MYNFRKTHGFQYRDHMLNSPRFEWHRFRKFPFRPSKDRISFQVMTVRKQQNHRSARSNPHQNELLLARSAQPLMGLGKPILHPFCDIGMKSVATLPNRRTTHVHQRGGMDGRLKIYNVLDVLNHELCCQFIQKDYAKAVLLDKIHPYVWAVNLRFDCRFHWKGTQVFLSYPADFPDLANRRFWGTSVLKLLLKLLFKTGSKP